MPRKNHVPPKRNRHAPTIPNKVGQIRRSGPPKRVYRVEIACGDEVAVRFAEATSEVEAIRKVLMAAEAGWTVTGAFAA